MDSSTKTVGDTLNAQNTEGAQGPEVKIPEVSDRQTEGQLATTESMDTEVANTQVAPEQKATVYYEFKKQSQRKRFKAALLKGADRETAYKLAMEAQEAAPSVPASNTQNDKAGAPAQPKFSEVVSKTKLGIASARNGSLSAAHLDLVKTAVLEEVLKNKDRSKEIIFEGAIPKGGWIQFICKDNNTASWLRKSFPSIVKATKLDLKILEQDDFPKPHIVHGIFPDHKEWSNERILSHIAAQNALPSAKTWQVVRRSNEGKVQSIVFGIDSDSLKILEKKNFDIGVGFNRIKMRMSKRSRNDGEATKGKPEPKKPRLNQVEEDAPKETPDEAAKQSVQDAEPECSRDTLEPNRKPTTPAQVEKVRKQMRRLSVESPNPPKPAGPTTRRQAGTGAPSKEKVDPGAKKATEPRGPPAKQKASGVTSEKK